MRSAPSRAKIQKCPSRRPGFGDQFREPRVFQCRNDLQRPFIARRVHVLCVHDILGMDQPRLNLFQCVRFFADVLDQVHVDVSPLQQTYGLLLADVSLGISALRLRVKLILARDIEIRLDAGCGFAAVQQRCGNRVRVFRSTDRSTVFSARASRLFRIP